MNSPVIGGAAITVLLAGTLAFSHWFDGRLPDTLSAPLESIPTDIAGWRSIASEQMEPRHLQALKPTSYLARIYARGDARIAFFVGYVAVQKPGQTIHSPKHCLPGGGWEIAGTGNIQVFERGQPLIINRLRIRNEHDRRTVLYWYQSRNRTVASEVAAKLALFRDAIVDGRTGGALVRIIVPDDMHDTPELSEFTTGAIREVQRCFGSV